MVTLRYQRIEEQLVDALPELKRAAEVYAKMEGPPGEDSGPYIFFEGMFACYVEVLLAMSASAGRDRLLARAFGFSERMLSSEDRDLHDLAYIGLYESRELWWFGRALPFLGSAARAELDENELRWQEAAQLQCEPDLEREIIDVYGVRDVILRELQGESYQVTDVPGITAPRSWEQLGSLEQARNANDAVAFLSCFGTTFPYVICPVSEVRCAEPVLLELACDLADIHRIEANQREKAQVAFFHIRLSERVWNMQIGSVEHARYDGKLWIADQFVKRGLVSNIQATVSR